MSESPPDPARLQRRLDRVTRARKEAERLLEEKSLELYEANQQLQAHSDDLEHQVRLRTQELEAALDQAKQAAKAKSEFLAVMSHEIRTPLNAVIGLSELLSMEELPESQREQIAVIHKNGQGLLELINDILDFSKMEARRLQLEEIEFSPVLEFKSWMNGFEVQHADRPVRLVLELGALPARLLGDRGRLRQIVFNLLSNAMKFTEQGEVRLSLTCRSLGDDRVHLTLKVRDTGIGMSAQQKERLFQPFTQADASINRRYGGTGLGLAISMRIAQAMGGEIHCESAEGVGTEFCVELRMRKVQERKPSLVSMGEECRCGGTALNILVVEDNQVNQMIISRMSEKLGHKVEVANHGREALEKVSDQTDIVLMDFIMPEMDGLECTRRIRKLDLERQPRIVALTANAFQEDKDHAREAGMDGFLSKPIHVEALRKELCASCPYHQVCEDSRAE